MAMKNRKTIIVAFMLLACMLLGVGYAALTDTLTIAGQANVTTGESSDEFKEDIYFKSANATAPDTATVLTDNNRASFTVNSLSLDGDTATFTFVIANESEHNATVAITATTIRDLIADGADEYIEIGPGNAISGFLKKTAKEMNVDINIMKIDTVEDFKKVIGE